jgi:hypothetical protein
MQTQMRSTKLSGSRQAARGTPVVSRNVQRKQKVSRVVRMNVRAEKVRPQPMFLATLT